MSHFSEYHASFSDEKTLIETLEEMGFKGMIEVHEWSQSLYGYKGDVRAQKANIIIRRKFIGRASNDIGFEKMPDGTYRIWISDYDKNRFNDKWIEQLKTAYTAKKIINKAKQKGFFALTKIGQNSTKVVLERYTR